MSAIQRRTLLAAALASSGGWALSGCGGQADKYLGEAQLRLVNASTGYAYLDLYVDGTLLHQGVHTGEASGYASVSPGDLGLSLRVNGSSTTLSTSTRTISKDKTYALVAYGASGALKTVLLGEDESTPASGKHKLLIENLGADAVGSLDVYLTGSDDALDDASAVASAVADASSTSFLSLSSGTYRLRVTAAGSKTDIRLDIAALTLDSEQVSTLLLTAGSGGVLVNAMRVVQQGSTPMLANPAARVRVVASVAGSGTVACSVGGTALLAAASPAIGAYTNIATGTQAVSLAVAGTAVSMASVNLDSGADYTLLVWGDAAAPTTLWVSDRNALPGTSTAAKLRLVHAVNGLGSALTLTADAYALASNIAQGAVSAYATVTGNSAMALDVSSPTASIYSTSSSGANVPAQSVFTVFALGDSGNPRVYLRRER